MTREEFIEKYGSVIVSFESYYKYTFTYKADLEDGKVISVSYGGNGDEIYRHETSRDARITVRDLGPYAGAVYVNGLETDSFYDY